MSLKSILLTTIAMMAIVTGAKADDMLDADGYPYLYVRGNMTGVWGANDAYRFTRDGNKYTLTLSSLKGTFKIGGSDWKYDFGGIDADINITESVNLTLTNAGQNLNANINNVTISLTLASLDLPVADTVVKFVVNGIDPGDDPGDTPGDKPVEGLSGTLPVLYINAYKTDDLGNFVLDGNGNKVLENEIIDINLPHKNYFTAEYWLDVNGCKWMEAQGAKSVGSKEEPLPTQIKARGNWTRIGFAKKPFKLKLGKKQNLLGLTPDKSKHYAILAHADDNYGFLRNFTGFNLGKRMQLPWTPSQQPVEVVINGNYRGLYFLTESIRVGDGRVPITELDDNVSDPALVSGGYLVELDNYEETNQISMPEQVFEGHDGFVDELRITWDTPEEYSALQRRFITEQFETINNLVGCNSDDLWQYLDMDDLARYYIVREMMSDVEAFHGSTYLFRDRGEGQKWHFSPIWDCGNGFNGSTSMYFYDNDPYGNTWIPSIRKNAKFNAKVQETWRWFMANKYDGIANDINDIVTKITPAVQADWARWRNSPTPDGGTRPADNTKMTERRDAALNHLKAKTAWLKQQWGNYDGEYSEPARDTTPAAPLPPYAISAINDVEADASDNAIYFDITGRRVINPTPGQLYIERQGSNVRKVVIKY